MPNIQDLEQLILYRDTCTNILRCLVRAGRDCIGLVFEPL